MEGEDYELAAAVDAAQTSPFLTDRRVVVVRNLARFSADELAPLVAYLGDPLPTTDLILVWEKAPGSTARLNPIPKKLSEALAGAGGEVVDTSVGRKREGLGQRPAGRQHRQPRQGRPRPRRLPPRR